MKTSTLFSERVAGCLEDDDMVDGDEEFVFGPCDVGDLQDKSGKAALSRRDGFLRTMEDCLMVSMGPRYQVGMICRRWWEIACFWG